MYQGRFNKDDDLSAFIVLSMWELLNETGSLISMLLKFLNHSSLATKRVNLYQ